MATMFASTSSSSQHHFEPMETSFSEGNYSLEQQEEQWAALAKIVRDVGPMLTPDEELQDIAEAEAAVQTKDIERATAVDAIQNELRLLTRQFNQAATAAQRPSTHPSTSEHDKQVRSLEQQQYTIGKQLNEEQATIAKREAELGRLRAQKEELSKVEIGSEDWVDGKIIRLKLFADAGFTYIPTKDATAPPKILIRNDAKSDIHTVAIDKPGLAELRVHYANNIWDLASE